MIHENQIKGLENLIKTVDKLNNFSTAANLRASITYLNGAVEDINNHVANLETTFNNFQENRDETLVLIDANRQSIDNLRISINTVSNALAELEKAGLVVSATKPITASAWINPDDMKLRVLKDGVWTVLNLTNETEVSFLETPQQAMLDFFHALTTINESDNVEGYGLLNTTIQGVTNKYSSFQDVIEEFSTLLQNSRLTPESFLYQYCGIDLTNEDTGSVMGLDAGGKEQLTAESVISEDLSVTPAYPTSTIAISWSGFPSGTYVMRFVTIDDITFLFPPPEELTVNEQRVMSYLAYWYLPAALKTIKRAYGLDFASSSLTTVCMTNRTDTVFFGNAENSYKMIPIFFSNSPYAPVELDNSTLALCVSGISINSLKAYWNTLIINHDFYANLEEGDFNGYSEAAGEYLDRCITHELVHAVMYSNIYKFTASQLKYIDSDNNTTILVDEPMPMWFVEGTAELIHGIDDYRTYNMIEVTKDPDRFISGLKNNIYVESEDAYSIGFIILRYLMKQLALKTSDSNH